MRGEDLEVARHDRDLHVGTLHGAHEVERLLVAADRGREQDAIDLELVDDSGDVLRCAEELARERRRAVAVEEADDLEAVLGVRHDLAVDEECLLAAADDQRPPRLQQAREHPASDRAAGDRDQQRARRPGR